MNKKELNKYFLDSNKYYDPKVFIGILESVLKESYESIQMTVFNAGVRVTKEEITDYLDKKFSEKEPVVKKRVEDRKKELEYRQNAKNKIEDTLPKMPLSAEYVEQKAQEFADGITAAKYSFNDNTLRYFQKYISIVRTKLTSLLNIIDTLANNDYKEIEENLWEFDINLNENGYINKTDAIRLLAPTIYNYEVLREKLEEANNLDTYLTFKISKEKLLRDGIMFSELLPNEELQVRNVVLQNGPGNIPLSKKQQNELMEEEKKRFAATAKLVLHLDD